MDIQSLPVELHEKILVNINDDTKIELVCKLWNEICKKEVIKKIRFPCICSELWPGYLEPCKSKIHRCICKKSPHHAKACRAKNHPCICQDDRDSVHHALMCRGENHPCICNQYSNFVLYCRHSGRCRFI